MTSEGGVAAGVRRIEAVTGFESLSAFERQRQEIVEVGGLTGALPGHVGERVSALLEENKRLARELHQAKIRAALGGAASTDAGVVDAAGIALMARRVNGLDKDALRALVDKHRDQLKSGVVVLAGETDGRVLVVVGVTPDLTTRVAAGKVVKQLAAIVGGGGGGRPDFAEAGGKDASKIDDLLASARAVVSELAGG